MSAAQALAALPPPALYWLHMNKLKIPLFIVIPLSFLLGLIWSVQVHREREAALGRLQTTHEIRVLAFKGILQRSLLKRFEMEADTKVILTEVATPEELWERLASPPQSPHDHFDVVSLMSYQVPIANQNVRLQPIEAKRLKNYSSLSRDFQDIPGEMNHSAMLPVLWGMTGLLYNTQAIPEAPKSWENVFSRSKSKASVGLLASTVDLIFLMNLPAQKQEAEEVALDRPLNKILSQASLSTDFLSAASLFQRPDPPSVIQINHGETAFPPVNSGKWRFVLPTEGGLLWVLSFALTRETKSAREAHLFLDFLLTRESAVDISKFSRQASTNRLLENSDLDPRLKPSFLRQFPLTQYRMWRDFSRSQQLRTLIPQATVN